MIARLVVALASPNSLSMVHPVTPPLAHIHSAGSDPSAAPSPSGIQSIASRTSQSVIRRSKSFHHRRPGAIRFPAGSGSSGRTSLLGGSFLHGLRCPSGSGRTPGAFAPGSAPPASPSLFFSGPTRRCSTRSSSASPSGPLHSESLRSPSPNAAQGPDPSSPHAMPSPDCISFSNPRHSVPSGRFTFASQPLRSHRPRPSIAPPLDEPEVRYTFLSAPSSSEDMTQAGDMSPVLPANSVPVQQADSNSGGGRHSGSRQISAPRMSGTGGGYGYISGSTESSMSLVPSEKEDEFYGSEPRTDNTSAQGTPPRRNSMIHDLDDPLLALQRLTINLYEQKHSVPPADWTDASNSLADSTHRLSMESSSEDESERGASASDLIIPHSPITKCDSPPLSNTTTHPDPALVCSTPGGHAPFLASPTPNESGVPLNVTEEKRSSVDRDQATASPFLQDAHLFPHGAETSSPAASLGTPAIHHSTTPHDDRHGETSTSPRLSPPGGRESHQKAGDREHASRAVGIKRTRGAGTPRSGSDSTFYPLQRRRIRRSMPASDDADHSHNSNCPPSVAARPSSPLAHDQTGGESQSSLTATQRKRFLRSSQGPSDLIPAGSSSPPLSAATNPSHTTRDPSQPRTETTRFTPESHKTESGMSVCDYVSPMDGAYCGVRFHRMYDLVRHKETIHGRDEAQAIRQGRLSLDQALVWGKEVNPSSSTADTQWLCETCDKTFSRKDALLRHRRLRKH